MKPFEIEKINDLLASIDEWDTECGSSSEHCRCSQCALRTAKAVLESIVDPPHRPHERYEERIRSYDVGIADGIWRGPNREKIFADSWEKQNRRKSWNGGFTTLEHIMSPHSDNSPPDPVSFETVEAVASAITWLGTNCGWSFLNETLRAAGYEINQIR